MLPDADPRPHRGGHYVDHGARTEDIAWMADTGESATRAAARLGMTKSALAKWCHEHNQRADWLRLLSNEPRDHNTPAAAMVVAQTGRRA